jgi:hypothetical protein
VNSSPNSYLEQIIAPAPQEMYLYSNRYDTVSVHSPDIAAPRPEKWGYSIVLEHNHKENKYTKEMQHMDRYIIH